MAYGGPSLCKILHGQNNSVYNIHIDRHDSFTSNMLHMGLLPYTWNCGLRVHRESREHFPRHQLEIKPLFSDPRMHHGTCVKHLPWSMSGSLTRGGRKNVPSIPGACVAILRSPSGRFACMLHIWGTGKRYVDVLCFASARLSWLG